MKLGTLLIVGLAACFIQSCNGARIVVTYAICSKSHMFAFMPVVEELARRGHSVTVFSPYAGIAKKVVNGREIVLEESAKLMETTPINWFAMPESKATQIFSMLPFIKEAAIKAGSEILNHPEFQKIIKNREADVFLVDALFNEFLYPIFDQTGIPFVTHSSSSAFPAVLASMGAPIDYAAVPTALVEFDDQMTFFQRMMNLIPNELFNQIRIHYIFKDLDKLVQSLYPGVKSITEVEGDASICILNSHPMTNWPRSLPPTIIPIGALHTRPAKPLPKKLQKFADEAKDGLIVFTLGSAVPVSTMPKKTLEAFIKVFSKLPQKVIWKWEAEIPANIPSNVMMVDWLPQQDLLGHPNAKVFITHGGMLGTQEGAYHGVPLLGIPFGNDQRGNLAKAKRMGWATQLEWDTIDEQSLSEALTYLLTDPNVRANASRVSRLMKDEILPGKDVAAYWVEYVIRHGSTKHLELATKTMPYYKQHLVDVFLFLFAILSLVLLSFYAFVRLILRCFSKKQKTVDVHGKQGKVKKNN